MVFDLYFCLQEEGLREGFGISIICSSTHKVYKSSHFPDSVMLILVFSWFYELLTRVLGELYIRYHMAFTPLLYSQGNAFDIVQMYELCIDLSIHLHVKDGVSSLFPSVCIHLMILNADLKFTYQILNYMF